MLEDFLRSYLPAKRAEPGEDIFSVLCQIETEDGERFSDEDVVNALTPPGTALVGKIIAASATAKR